jgi:cell division inhibitor SepF
MRRLIDFASGLCYGLNGKLDKVASGVYLLTPANVSDEDRRQMAGRDYD